MPLSFTPIRAGHKWRGFTWTVEDEDELATLLARVAAGQATIVERILKDTECAVSRCSTTGGLQGARNLLSVKSGNSPAHRDGWIFQVISWVATHLQAYAAGERTLIRPPHMIHAEKGQDGLIIEYSNEDIARVVICEDKATKHPRRQFRRNVLSDFGRYETGARDNELIAGVTSMLGRKSIKGTDAIVENIFWKEQRAYRVAITVGVNNTSASDRSRLFKGYANTVPGVVSRRRVELMPLADLRAWMNTLAEKALVALDQHDV